MFFFCVVAGVHVPRFCFSFLSPLFLGFVFFFGGFLCSFFALGAGRLAVLFSPSSFGACFCLFFFYFSGFFRRFFFSKGLVLFVGPFLGLFWGSWGALRKDFFCFFLGFFLLLLGCMFLVFASLFCPRSFRVLFFFFFFLSFFVPFLPSELGVVLFFFPPLFLGLVFRLFFFYFFGFFCRFFFSKGLVLFVGLFLGLFWYPGGL